VQRDSLRYRWGAHGFAPVAEAGQSAGGVYVYTYKLVVKEGEGDVHRWSVSPRDTGGEHQRRFEG